MQDTDPDRVVSHLEEFFSEVGDAAYVLDRSSAVAGVIKFRILTVCMSITSSLLEDKNVFCPTKLSSMYSVPSLEGEKCSCSSVVNVCVCMLWVMSVCLACCLPACLVQGLHV